MALDQNVSFTNTQIFCIVFNWYIEITSSDYTKNKFHLFHFDGILKTLIVSFKKI